MRKLLLIPTSAYSVGGDSDTLSVKLAGGASRYRRDKLGSWVNAIVQWILTPEEYLYLRAFYHAGTASGSLPFLIDLRFDESDLSEMTAYFVPGSLQLSAADTNQVTISATLEIQPNPMSNDSYLLIIELFENGISYDDFIYYESLLNTVVNTLLPEALPA